MVTSGDQAIIAFFTEHQKRDHQRNSDHGEVPQVFKTNEFLMCISGFNLALPNPWRPVKLHAKLSTQSQNATTFVHKLTTETIEGVCSPVFTKKVVFAPLQMNNSQNEARNTLVKVDIYLYDDLVFSMKFELARLLWDTRIEKLVKPVIPNLVVVKNRKATQGKLVVDIIRGRPIGTPPDNHKVVLNFELCSGLWAKIAEQKVYFALCSVGFRGRWNRVIASEAVKKPFMRNFPSIFPRIYVSRGELTNDNPSNPIRIELYGHRKGYHKLLGYCHATLAELSKPRDLIWNTRPSTMSANMKVTASHMSHTQSEINFRLHSRSTTKGVIRVSSGIEHGMPVNQSRDALCESMQSPTCLRNAKFELLSRENNVNTLDKSITVTPKNFVVHFPATHIL